MTTATLTFDTLAYAKRLQAAGVPREQAEVQAEAMREIVEDKLSTKRDLQEMELRLNARICSEINDLKRDIREQELRMTLKLGGMMAASVAIVAALVKLL